MSNAALAQDSFALESTDFESEPPKRSAIVIDASSLNRARHWYVARTLANPHNEAATEKLSYIRRLGWLLILFQILDGVFTSLGVRFFGIEVEGNPLVKLVIETCGAPLGLTLIKLFAIGIIFSICTFGFRVTWLSRALTGVAGVYFFCAIVPWSLLLLSLV